MTLRLSDIEAPLDEVEFPDGSVHTPRPFGPTEYKLWRAVQTETDAGKRGTALLTIMRGCYPTATDENFESCTVRMVWAMLGHAARNIEMVKTALKNGVAVTTAETPPPSDPQDTPPSSPKPSGNTSSRNTRKRSGKTGGTSTTASHTDVLSSSGSPTTISTIAGESMPCAVNWMTSTAPSSPPTP